MFMNNIISKFWFALDKNMKCDKKTLNPYFWNIE